MANEIVKRQPRESTRAAELGHGVYNAVYKHDAARSHNDQTALLGF